MSDLDFSSPADESALTVKQSRPLTHLPVFPTSTPNYNLPLDDFDVPNSMSKHTIFYLTVSTSHTDEFTIHGPERYFSKLMPHIKKACSSSPPAIAKLESLRKMKDLEFDTYGFNTFIIELERGAYSRLQVIREVNKPIYDILPGPHYIVTAHGPLTHNIGSAFHTIKSGKPRGMATTSRVIGSFLEAEEARDAARTEMDRLLVEGQHMGGGQVMKDEKHETGKRGWVCLAMNSKATWEVRVRYEADFWKGLGGTWRV